MQLKFKRYTGSKGMIFKDTTYCLEALAQPTAEEQASIITYNRANDMLYLLADREPDHDEDLTGQINRPTVADLMNGIRLEFKNFNNVLRAESVIARACQKLLATIAELDTFDGSERVVEVQAGSLELAAAG